MRATGRKLLIVAALAAGPLLAMSAAHADEISLGGSSATMSFTSAGTGTISFTSGGFSGSANFESPTGTVLSTGTFTLGALSGSAGPESGGVFPITSGGTDTFTYKDGTNSLTGTATFAGIKDGTANPQFDVGSTISITASSGSSTFTSDFKTGGTAEIDFTLGGVSPTLATIATASGGGSTSGFFSSGEVMPTTTTKVPEPGSLTLFGTALLGIGLFFGLRRSKRV